MGLISRVSSRTYRPRNFARTDRKMTETMDPSQLFQNLVKQSRAQDDMYDTYRDDNEDTKHWYCRKQFIKHNYDNFIPTNTSNMPEDILMEKKDRLDCLSRCWANVQFYQTSYPA